MRAVDTLISLVNGPHDTGRYAARALGQLEDRRAIPALIDAFFGDDYARIEKANILVNFGTMDIVFALRARVQHETRAWVKQMAEETIKRIEALQNLI